LDIVPNIIPESLTLGAAKKRAEVEEGAKPTNGGPEKKAPSNTNHQGNQRPSTQAPTSWGNNGFNINGWINSG